MVEGTAILLTIENVHHPFAKLVRDVTAVQKHKLTEGISDQPKILLLRFCHIAVKYIYRATECFHSAD